MRIIMLLKCKIEILLCLKHLPNACLPPYQHSYLGEGEREGGIAAAMLTETS